MWYLSLEVNGYEYCLEPLIGAEFYSAKYKDEEIVEPKKKMAATELLTEARRIAEAEGKELKDWVIKIL